MSASSVMTMNKAIVFVAFKLLAMAMVEVAADGVPFSMTGSDQPEFQFMHGLSASSVMYYSPPANGTVMFGLRVPSEGWVGLGWSKDCEMFDADVVIAGVGAPTGTPGTFRTSPSPAHSIEADTELATRIGLRAAWNSSIAFLTVHRSMDGGNVAINGTSMCVIWAHSNISTPGYHGRERRGALVIPLAADGSLAAPQESMAAEESGAPASDATPQSIEMLAEDETLIADESGPSVSSPASGSAPAAGGSAPAAGGSAPAAGGSAPAAGGSALAAIRSVPAAIRSVPAAIERAQAASGSAPASSGSTITPVNPAVSIGVGLIVALFTFSAYLVA